MPKVGEIWNSKIGDTPLKIVVVNDGDDYCDVIRGKAKYASSISFTTLNEFYKAPLNSKLDVLLGEENGS